MKWEFLNLKISSADVMLLQEKKDDIIKQTHKVPVNNSSQFLSENNSEDSLMT